MRIPVARETGSPCSRNYTPVHRHRRSVAASGLSHAVSRLADLHRVLVCVTFFYSIFFVIACSFLPFRKRFILARVWDWYCCGTEMDLQARLSHRRRRNLPTAITLPCGNTPHLGNDCNGCRISAPGVGVKRELLWIPVVGWGIRQLHAIAIDRKSGIGGGTGGWSSGKQRAGEEIGF